VELAPLSVEEAEAIHQIVMSEYPEEPSGTLNRGLLESTLLRPANAAAYNGADEYGQAGTLLWGLVRNHVFAQGNKRTATVIAFFFLERAGYKVDAPEQAVIDLVYAVESGTASVEDVARWFRHYVLRPEN
jgi:death-on-curing protein